jgi:hypothetical protein
MKSVLEHANFYVINNKIKAHLKLMTRCLWSCNVNIKHSKGFFFCVWKHLVAQKMFISIEGPTIHMQTFYHSNKNLMYIYIREYILPRASLNLRVGLFHMHTLMFWPTTSSLQFWNQGRPYLIHNWLNLGKCIDLSPKLCIHFNILRSFGKWFMSWTSQNIGCFSYYFIQKYVFHPAHILVNLLKTLGWRSHLKWKKFKKRE